MGYLFLACALFAGVTKGYCGKRTSGYTANFHDAVFANTIRVILCAVIGFCLIIASGELRFIVPSFKMLLISALSGVSTAVFVVTWLVCVKKSAYMMIDTFLMLGVLIPLIASKICFNEDIKLTQWIGIFILLIAVLLMCSYNNSIKSKITPTSFLILVVCGAANGFADFSQKVYNKAVPDSSATVFNFYTYIFAALFLICAFFLTRKSKDENNKANVKKIFIFIVIMAICLFANSFFKTLAAGHLSAVLLYPLNQGCALILSALMASVLFKEKLTVKAIIGIFTAFAGLIIINVL